MKLKFYYCIGILFVLVWMTIAQECIRSDQVAKYIEICKPYFINNESNNNTFPDKPLIYHQFPGWLVKALLYPNLKAFIEQQLLASLQTIECHSHLLSLLCNWGLPWCETKTVINQITEEFKTETNISLPFLPCRSLCEKTQDKCNLTLDFNGQNCSSLPTDKCQNQVLTQVDDTVEGLIFPVPVCGGVLELDQKTHTCMLKCPSPGFVSDTMISAINWTLWIAVPIALLLLVLMFIFKILYQRDFWFKYPIFLIIICDVAIILALTGFLMAGARGGLANHACVDNTHPVEGNVAAVTAQAWILYSAAWLQLSTFAIICFNLFLVVMKFSVTGWKFKILMISYFTVIIIPPIVVLVSTQVTGNLGYCSGGVSTICLFKDVTVAGVPDGITFFSLTLPFTISIGMGYFLLFLMIMRLLLNSIPNENNSSGESTNASSSSSSTSTSQNLSPRISSNNLLDYTQTNIWKRLQLKKRFSVLIKQWRMLFFVILYGGSLLMALVVFWSSVINHDSILQAAEEYYQCKTLNWLASIDLLRNPYVFSKNDCDNSGMQAVIPFLQWWTLGFIGVMMSILLLLFFAPKCYKLYISSQQIGSLSLSDYKT